MFLPDDEKYKAVVENDENYDGIFYYAVKSTGVFCRPSCKSKIPKKENTLYFNNPKDAINNGFRVCKRCRSDLLEFNPSKEIASKVKYALENMFLQSAKLNNELNKVGVSKRQMVEIFKKEHGVTPKVYADKLKINEAKRLLFETQNDILDISLSLGFNSLSAFYKFFKVNTGSTPKAYRKEVDDELRGL